MTRRPEPNPNPKSSAIPLPDCFGCAFVLLQEVQLKRSQERFSGIFASYRPWHPPANRRLVMHHTDGFVGES